MVHIGLFLERKKMSAALPAAPTPYRSPRRILAEPSQRDGAAYWNRSELSNSLFGQMNSLFGESNSLFRAEQGNYPQRIGIAAQMDARTQWKAPKWSEISKIPCYFPCSEGIRGEAGRRSRGIQI
jgi:hypothetical protein